MSMVTNVQARPKRSPRKRLSFYLVYLVSLLLFSAIAAEALARLVKLAAGLNPDVGLLFE